MPTRTTCPYCGVGCGVLARADGPGTAEIAGHPAHPANFGRLCSKGAALGETLSLEGRLLYPSMDGARTSWDAALDRVAAGFADTIARHGPDSVALYVSGQLLTEDYYAANKLAKGFLGTANIDSNSRLCMASAVAAHRRAFGEDLVPGTYEDLELADLVVLVGSNLAWCHPVLHQRIAAARVLRPGMRVVVIDPRRTATCEGADLHLALAPGSDVALFNGLLGHLRREGKADTRFLQHLSGVDAALAHAIDTATAAASCGLPIGDVARFFGWFADTPCVVTVFSQGVNQSSAGTDKANAIINAHLLTGRIGTPGAGPFSVTGQPNAMGGREVGALSNMLAAHLDWDRPGDADLLRRYWAAPALAERPGLKAVDLFQAIGDGRVRAVWIMGTNPAVSLPDGDRVRRALAGCELVVVSDPVAESDTMDLAHVRLPALAWGEKDGTVTNSERVISRQRPFLPLPGEARANWWAIAQVARRLGHGSAFAWRGPADIFREHAALSGVGNGGQRVFDISALAGLSDAEYEAMPPIRWPCPAARPAQERLLGDGRFPMPDGRGRMVPTPLRGPAHAVSEDWPLALMTGRLRDQWHTMTRTGKAPRLFAHAPEPVVSLHPLDAGSIVEGGFAVVESAWGRGVFRARLDPGMRRGAVFVPMHWTDRFCRAARANAAVNPAADPVSGQPEFKHTPVCVRPWTPAWHGFALGRVPLGQDVAAWCAAVPAGAGLWRHELASEGPAEAAHAALVALHDGPGTWITLHDANRGVHRAALVRDGSLRACVFVGPDAGLPPRNWLLGLFAAESITLADRRALLAGRPFTGAAPEPSVCVCHGVGAGAIRRAIHAGCGDLERIGQATRAGTNCGSCRPEIAALLAAHRVAEPA